MLLTDVRRDVESPHPLRAKPLNTTNQSDYGVYEPIFRPEAQKRRLSRSEAVAQKRAVFPARRFGLQRWLFTCRFAVPGT